LRVFDYLLRVFGYLLRVFGYLWKECDYLLEVFGALVKNTFHSVLFLIFPVNEQSFRLGEGVEEGEIAALMTQNDIAQIPHVDVVYL
jgi:hypothetical protein